MQQETHCSLDPGTLPIDTYLWSHRFNDPNFEHPRGPTLSPAQFAAWQKTISQATTNAPEGSTTTDGADVSASGVDEHADPMMAEDDCTPDTEHGGKVRHAQFQAAMSDVPSAFDFFCIPVKMARTLVNTSKFIGLCVARWPQRQLQL